MSDSDANDAYDSFNDEDLYTGENDYEDFTDSDDHSIDNSNPEIEQNRHFVKETLPIHLQSQEIISFRDLFSNGYHPTRSHVNLVVQMLNSKGLPLELILIILDMAEYWHLFRVANIEKKQLENGRFSSLQSGLIPIHGRRIKKVRVISLSHDQGWATGEGSWTWANIKVSSPIEQNSQNQSSSSVQPSIDSKSMEFYRNIRAESKWQVHEKIINPFKSSSDFEFLSFLVINQGQLEVEYYAAFPGWVNSFKWGIMEIWYSSL